MVSSKKSANTIWLDTTPIDTENNYTDVELNFLKRIEGAELFFDSEILDKLAIKKSLKTNHIDTLTASISSLNISTSAHQQDGRLQ